MDIPIVDIEFCEQHKRKIQLYFKERPEGVCRICVQEMMGKVFADSEDPDEFQESYEKRQKELVINWTIKTITYEKQLLQCKHDSILDFKNEMINSFDLNLKLIQDQIDSAQVFLENLQQINSSEKKTQQIIQEIQKEYQNMCQNNNVVINQTVKLLTDISNKNFKLQSIVEQNRKNNTDCLAFSFNQQNTILAVGQRNHIILYEFNNGKIGKEIEILANHTDWVNHLQFFKKYNSIVSGSDDFSIIIWEFDQTKSRWLNKQQLIGHQNAVKCFLINKNEDQLISGSIDKTIKFWIKNNNQNWRCSQTLVLQFIICSLSLNEQENKLISCGIDSPILIMEQDIDYQWKTAQIIRNYGYRLQFTVGDQFAFQPADSDEMVIYEYNQLQKQFEKFQSLKIQYQKDYFSNSCQFIKQVKILTIKHGQYINVFQINQDFKYQLIETIDYYQYAWWTNDGQYLVGWNKKEQQIQVRNLNSLNEIGKHK